MLENKRTTQSSVRLVTDLQEWESYFASVPMPHLEQTVAYGEVKRKERKLRIERYAFEIAGSPVAICQVMKKYLGGVRIASRIERGPLFLERAPSYEVKKNVLHAIRSRWKIFNGGPLEFQPALDVSEENKSILTDLGFRDLRTQTYWSTVVDLQPETDEMRRRLDPKWRNQLKRAEGSGLTFRSDNTLESVEWMLDRHAENMHSKGFSHPSRSALEKFYMEDPSNFHVMQALAEGEPVAGIVVVRFGQKAEYYVGWFGALGRKFNCGNFLLWNAAVEMKRAGCKLLDLRGLNPDHKYTEFKLGMRGPEYKLMGKWLCM